MPVIGDGLYRFANEQAATVLGWVRSMEELESWASRTDFPLPLEVFREWHADPDVHPHVLLEGGPIAYGEVWTDSDENEAELARIIVAPEARGRGVGRRLVTLLVAEAERLGFDEIWLRVVPANAPAIASYTNAGFRRAEPDEEERFNRGQPRNYVWMRFSPPSHGRVVA